MGALLLTDNGESLDDVFDPGAEAVSYGSSGELVDRLDDTSFTTRTSDPRSPQPGQARTLRDHTYRQRMQRARRAPGGRRTVLHASGRGLGTVVSRCKVNSVGSAAEAMSARV